MLPITVTQTITTSASPDDVWSAFATIARWPETMSSLREVALEPEGPLAAGSSIRSVSASGAKRNERVVEADVPHRLVLAIEDEAFRARTEYMIAPGEDGTDITVTGTLNARGFSESIRFLLWRERMTPMLKTTLRERTKAIADLAERMRNEH